MVKTRKTKKPIFSENVILLRKKKGWNALVLAEKAGIAYPTLRDIEAGYSGGWASTREAIAKALGCTVADLYRDPVTQKIQNMPASHLTPESLEEIKTATRQAIAEQMAERDMRPSMTFEHTKFRDTKPLVEEAKHLLDLASPEMVKTITELLRQSVATEKLAKTKK